MNFWPAHCLSNAASSYFESSMVYSAMINNQYCYIIITSTVYPDVAYFGLIYSRIPSGHHIVFSHQVLGSSAKAVSQNFLILDALDSSEEILSSSL